MSGYAKLPSDDDDAPHAPEAERASRLGLAVHGAGKVARSLGEGLRGASHMLDDPRAGDIDTLLQQGNLPPVTGDDPLRELSQRLDAEADLWRGVAFRQLAQTRFTGRLLQIVSMVVVISEVGLGMGAAIGAAFGGSGTGQRRSLLLGAGSISLFLGLAAFAIVAQLSRKADREVMRDAMVRADLAELRLHRVAMALAATKADPEKASEAIARLENETRR